jgi:hypothetical protein
MANATAATAMSNRARLCHLIVNRALQDCRIAGWQERTIASNSFLSAILQLCNSAI